MIKTKIISYIVAGISYPRNEKEEKYFIDENEEKEKQNKWTSFFSIKTQKKKNDLFSSKNLRKQFFSYDNIELYKKQLQKTSRENIFSFHFYLTPTYKNFISSLSSCDSDLFVVLPLFPQFSYSLSGKIAHFFQKNLPHSILSNLFWIKSFPINVVFIQTYKTIIKTLMKEKQFKEEETIFLFTAANPSFFSQSNEKLFCLECNYSAKNILKKFPYALGQLGYQVGYFSKNQLTFSPSTSSLINQINQWSQRRKNVVIIPLNLLLEDCQAEHEITSHFILRLKEKGYNVATASSFYANDLWLNSFYELLEEKNFIPNEMLIPLDSF